LEVTLITDCAVSCANVEKILRHIDNDFLKRTRICVMEECAIKLNADGTLFNVEINSDLTVRALTPQ
jgi:hypothetical protein